MYAENEIKFIEDKIRADEQERITKLLEDEQIVMKKSKGATFGRNLEYDKGYNAALADAIVLINK